MNLTTTNRKNQEKNKSLKKRLNSSRPYKMNLRLWAHSKIKISLSPKEFGDFISSLSKTQLKIFGYLLWFWANKKVPYMNQETIGSQVNCKREWANKSLALLKTNNVLDWYSRFNQSNIYRAAPQILTRDYLQVLLPYYPFLRGFYLGLFSVASLGIPASFLDAHDRNYRTSVHTNINCYILPTHGVVFESTAPVSDTSFFRNCNSRIINFTETGEESNNFAFEEVLEQHEPCTEKSYKKQFCQIDRE